MTGDISLYQINPEALENVSPEKRKEIFLKLLERNEYFFQRCQVRDEAIEYLRNHLEAFVDQTKIDKIDPDVRGTLLSEGLKIIFMKVEAILAMAER